MPVYCRFVTESSYGDTVSVLGATAAPDSSTPRRPTRSPGLRVPPRHSIRQHRDAQRGSPGLRVPPRHPIRQHRNAQRARQASRCRHGTQSVNTGAPNAARRPPGAATAPNPSAPRHLARSQADTIAHVLDFLATKSFVTTNSKNSHVGLVQGRLGGVTTGDGTKGKDPTTFSKGRRGKLSRSF